MNGNKQPRGVVGILLVGNFTAHKRLAVISVIIVIHINLKKL